MDWYIGCSGFYYREWKEIFYPNGLPQKSWFKYYCEHFNTIEINSTFYKMPTQKSFEKWYTESPDHFLFSIKAPRLITHYKQLNDCEELITNFYEAIKQGLQQKLGCVLFQFPPKFSYTEERLALILKNLNSDFSNVIEFRHKSWWQKDIFNSLRRAGIIFSGASFPGNLPDEVIQNTQTIYYRFHGKPILYKSEYTNMEMQNFVNKISKSAQQVFVYFNNTWGSAALTNSKQLIKIVNQT